MFELPWIHESCLLYPLRKVLKSHKCRYLVIISVTHEIYIYMMIATAPLSWTGHIARLSDTRLRKQSCLYGELSSGKRSHGGQRKRFKDSLKINLKRFDIDTGARESAAADRSRWRTAIRDGGLLFESNRRRDLSDKRLQRKHREAEARTRPPAFALSVARTATHALASSATIAHIGLNLIDTRVIFVIE